MKIVMILTNRFDPDVRVYKEAKYLVENGHEVEILCWDRENEYLEKSIENIEGIMVKRFFPYSKYGSGIKQVVPFTRFILEVNKYLSNVEYDFLHCHDLDGVFTGYFVRRKNIPLVFDMHEYYEMQKSNKIIRIIVKIIVRFFQKKAYKIIYVNEYQIMSLRNTVKTKCIYLPNYPDKSNFQNPRKTVSEKLRISYIGIVGQFKQLKNLMDASRGISEVSISIHGNGIAFERLKAIEDEYDNVTITGKYRFDESEKLYNDTDLHYVVYSMNNVQNKLSEPVKFYESIATKTPMIVNEGSKIGKFVQENRIGYTIDGDKIEDIRELILFIQKNSEELKRFEKNLENIKDKYIWQNVVTNLSQIY